MGRREREERSREDALVQDELKASGPLPAHIAIIMDGNGRWAKQRGLRRVQGHYEGVASVRDVTEACAELGIEELTLYTFSTENWSRPAAEVTALMQMLVRTLRKELKTLQENQIRLSAIGNLDDLPDACRAELEDVLSSTATNSRMTLTLALSYSGRWDLTRAARTLATRVASGELKPEDVDADLLESALSTRDHPDVDLLIRTGGEIRVSNFLLWEIAYAELFFSPQFWPSFRRDHLYEAIRSYQERDRRFGRVKA